MAVHFDVQLEKIVVLVTVRGILFPRSRVLVPAFFRVFHFCRYSDFNPVFIRIAFAFQFP